MRIHSLLVKNGVFLITGMAVHDAGLRGFHASASAGMESVTRLIHRMCTGERIVQPTKVAIKG
jgi:hypothetical protein